MTLGVSALPLIFLLAVPPQCENQPTIYLKHLEPPLHYPALGRQVQIQGTVIVELTIRADGAVLATESLAQEGQSLHILF